MKSLLFDDIIDPKSDKKSIIGDAIYDRVREAIMHNLDGVEIFTPIFSSDSYPAISGIKFSLNSSQFNLFLTNYIKVCEEREDYERCMEILDLTELIS